MTQNKVTFLIPVRNEYHNLLFNHNAYQSLVANGHQVIIINDASTDQTASLLTNKFSFCQVVELQETDRQANIIGKNNALIHGYRYAQNDILCFVDADVYNLTAENIAKILQQYEQQKIYTTIPQFINKGIIENFSLFFQQLLYSNFALLKTDRELFGGFYLLDRQLYEKVGGHQAVAHEIVEDLALGNLLGAQSPIEVLTQTGLQIRMYRSLPALITGWSKNISYGFKHIKIINTIVLVAYIFLLGVLLFSDYGLLMYVLVTILFILGSNFYLKTRKLYMLFWPIYYLFFILIFFYSLVTKTKEWKGRKYST